MASDSSSDDEDMAKFASIAMSAGDLAKAAVDSAAVRRRALGLWPAQVAGQDASHRPRCARVQVAQKRRARAVQRRNGGGSAFGNGDEEEGDVLLDATQQRIADALDKRLGRELEEEEQRPAETEGSGSSGKKKKRGREEAAAAAAPAAAAAEPAVDATGVRLFRQVPVGAVLTLERPAPAAPTEKEAKQSKKARRAAALLADEALAQQCAAVAVEPEARLAAAAAAAENAKAATAPLGRSDDADPGPSKTHGKGTWRGHPMPEYCRPAAAGAPPAPASQSPAVAAPEDAAGKKKKKKRRNPGNELESP